METRQDVFTGTSYPHKSDKLNHLLILKLSMSLPWQYLGQDDEASGSSGDAEGHEIEDEVEVESDGEEIARPTKKQKRIHKAQEFLKARDKVPIWPSPPFPPEPDPLLEQEDY